MDVIQRPLAQLLAVLTTLLPVQDLTSTSLFGKPNLLIMTDLYGVT